MSRGGFLRWTMNSMEEEQVSTESRLWLFKTLDGVACFVSMYQLDSVIYPLNNWGKFCFLLIQSSNFVFFFAAFCDVTPYLKCYSWAVKECQRYGEKWTKKWAHEPTLIRVSAEIPEIMAHHATPVNSELYPTWDKFLQDFLKRGGWMILKACSSKGQHNCVIYGDFWN